ncbi:MAG: TolB family protein [Catenulispora sp.]
MTTSSTNPATPGPKRRGRSRVMALAASAALMAGALAPTAAHATLPGGNGRIYYFVQSAIPLSGNVFSVNPDGTGKVQLTTDGLAQSGGYPDPAGTRVAFLRSDFFTGSVQVWTMNPDGSGPTRLTYAAGATGGFLSWSPDGGKLVYAPGGTLTVINADGSHPVSLGVSYPVGEDWSPDGTRIAYADGNGLYTIRPDGTGRTLVDTVPAPLLIDGLSWSPDGGRLVFSAFADNGDSFGNGQIYTVHADGTAHTRILADATNNDAPVWSPDGTKIAIYVGGRVDTINPDGTGERRVGTITGSPNAWARRTTTSP